MIAEWFVLSNGESIGPYTHDQIVGMIHEGSLSPASYIRKLDGPWMTIAEAFFRMVAAAPNTSTFGAANAPEILAPEPVVESEPPPEYAPAVQYAPTTSVHTARYRRKKKSSNLNLLMAIASVVVGGAAAIYTAKSLNLGFGPKVIEESEPEVVVIERQRPTPKRPKVSDLPREPRMAKPPIEEVANIPIAAPVPAPVSSVPKPTAQPTATPPQATVVADPVDEAKAIAWLKALEAIDARRDILMSKMSELRREVAPVIDEAQSIDAACRPKEKEISELKHDIADLSIQISGRRQANEFSNSGANDSAILTLTSTLANCESKIRALNTVAQRAEYRKLMGTIAKFQKQDQSLGGEADSLRAELIRHLDPFTDVSEPLAKVALEYFRRPAPNDNAVIKAWNEFGLACIYLRKHDEVAAEKHLKAAMTAEPKEGTFRAIRGYWRLRLGEEDEADAELVAALKDGPENWTVNYLFALYQCRKGSLAAAERHLRKCRDLDKDNSDGLVVLSLLKSASTDDKIRNAKFAKQFAEEAMNAEKTPAVHFAMSAALAESGEFPEALKHAESAVAAPAKNEAVEFYRQSVALLNEGKPMRIDWTTLDVWNRL